MRDILGGICPKADYQQVTRLFFQYCRTNFCYGRTFIDAAYLAACPDVGIVWMMFKGSAGGIEAASLDFPAHISRGRELQYFLRGTVNPLVHTVRLADVVISTGRDFLHRQGTETLNHDASLLTLRQLLTHHVDERGQYLLDGLATDATLLDRRRHEPSEVYRGHG